MLIVSRCVFSLAFIGLIAEAWVIHEALFATCLSTIALLCLVFGATAATAEPALLTLLFVAFLSFLAALFGSWLDFGHVHFISQDESDAYDA